MGRAATAEQKREHAVVCSACARTEEVQAERLEEAGGLANYWRSSARGVCAEVVTNGPGLGGRWGGLHVDVR
jgi:hypothetical protein